MADPHVLTALVAKRAELAGQIEHAQVALRQLIIDLDNLDATIRLFRPDIDLEEIKPKAFPPRNGAARGEIMRVVLGTLRTAKKPLSTHEITMHVMAHRCLNTADTRLVRTVGKRVGASLRHYRGTGVIQSDQGPGQYMLWEIAR